MMDTGKKDHKIIAVGTSDPEFKVITTLTNPRPIVCGCFVDSSKTLKGLGVPDGKLFADAFRRGGDRSPIPYFELKGDGALSDLLGCDLAALEIA